MVVLIWAALVFSLVPHCDIRPLHSANFVSIRLQLGLFLFFYFSFGKATSKDDHPKSQILVLFSVPMHTCRQLL